MIIGHWSLKGIAPGTPQRIPTSLSAAPCGGLTRFTSGKPTDLGRWKSILSVSLAAVYVSRRCARRDSHGQILAHPVRDHGETGRAGLIRLQCHGADGAVLRHAQHAENASVGHGGA